MVWVNLIYALAMMIISFAIQMVMRPKPTTQQAVAGKLDVPTAKEGGTIPVVFGTMLIKDSNVVDYFDAKTTPITSEGKSGK